MTTLLWLIGHYFDNPNFLVKVEIKASHILSDEQIEILMLLKSWKHENCVGYH